MSTNLFEAFNSGSCKLPKTTIEFSALPWSKHPTFAGVELKHLITARESGGNFSCHLVRIAPGKSIGSHIHEAQLELHEVIAGSGVCINDGVTVSYEAGTISIFPAAVPHEVTAGKDGLFLFAKFMPALC